MSTVGRVFSVHQRDNKVGVAIIIYVAFCNTLLESAKKLGLTKDLCGFGVYCE